MDTEGYRHGGTPCFGLRPSLKLAIFYVGSALCTGPGTFMRSKQGRKGLVSEDAVLGAVLLRIYNGAKKLTYLWREISPTV